VAEVGSVLEASLAARWKKLRRELRRCRRSPSVEAVHDLRVAMRRMISALELVRERPEGRGADKLRRRLRRQLRRFRALRDAQVQLAEIGGWVRRFPALGPYVEALEARERRLRRQAARRARAIRLESFDRTVRRVRRLLRASGGEIREAALEAVGRAVARVLRRRRRAAGGAPEALHRFRIAFKRFRYAAEALRPVVPELTVRTMRRMHDLQLLLGAIHDTQLLARDAGFVGGAARRLRERGRRLLGRLRREWGAVATWWPPGEAKRARVRAGRRSS
jgi:CHAD domain-containing protein